MQTDFKTFSLLDFQRNFLHVCYRPNVIWVLLMLSHSMRSRVYVTVKRPSVSASVCPIERQQQRQVAGLSALRAGDQSTAVGVDRAAGAGV